MSDQGFRRADEVAVRAMRDDDVSASVYGYLDGAGAPRAMPGDALFPFVKDPPDIEVGGILRSKQLASGAANNLPLVAQLSDYDVGPVVDVVGWRALNLFLSYKQGTDLGDGGVTGHGILSLYMQGKHASAHGAAAGTDTPWLMTGVVNPSLVSAGFSAGNALAAARYAYPSEIRVDPKKLPDSAVAGVGVSPVPTIDLALTFDVSMHTQIRFLFGTLEKFTFTGTLDATYLLQR